MEPECHGRVLNNDKLHSPQPVTSKESCMKKVANVYLTVTSQYLAEVLIDIRMNFLYNLFVII